MFHLFSPRYNLGQNKKKQLTPFLPPKSNDEGAKEQKGAILASLKWGDGWSRCSIYFAQDCRSLHTGSFNSNSNLDGPPAALVITVLTSETYFASCMHGCYCLLLNT